jgi:uncharacterized protein YkwD
MHFSAITASLLVSGSAAHQGRWPPHYGWGHHHSSGVAATGGFPTGGFPTGGFPTGAFPTGAFPTGGYSVATSFKTIVVSVPSTVSAEGFPTKTAVYSKKTSAAVSIATSAAVSSVAVSTTSAAVPATTSASSGSGSLTSDEQAALDAHNAARAEVGTKDLVWDTALVADALAYAQTLASSGTFQHSGVEGQGENLYMQSNTDNPLVNGVNAFISEKSEYDGGVITESNYSHYTQCVWKDTTNVGMASAKGANGNTYVVARYSPPGN